MSVSRGGDGRQGELRDGRVRRLRWGRERGVPVRVVVLSMSKTMATGGAVRHVRHRRQMWRVRARARHLLPRTPVAGEAQSCGPCGRAYGLWAVCERVLTEVCSVFFIGESEQFIVVLLL